MEDPRSPFELPPLPPPISMKRLNKFMDFLELHNDALRTVSQLEGAIRELDRPEMFLSTFYLQESISSSAVENIHTTIESAMEDETKPAKERTEANKEVMNYRSALMKGRDSLNNFGLTSRTIKTVHEHLAVAKGRPGEYRRLQNHIANRKKDGTTEIIYTPPLWNRIDQMIGNWETFAATDKTFFPLIKAAICHYQFEAIHPFEDGNGRTGRILMILQILEEELLSYPALFISGYLSKYEDEYKRLLQEVTTKGAWWPFIVFMLRGFQLQALETRISILQLKKAKKELKGILFNLPQKPIRMSMIVTVLDHIFLHPITHAKFMERETGIHWQTCSKHLRSLCKLGVLREQPTGKYKLFRNQKAFDALVVR